MSHVLVDATAAAAMVVAVVVVVAALALECALLVHEVPSLELLKKHGNDRIGFRTGAALLSPPPPPPPLPPLPPRPSTALDCGGGGGSLMPVPDGARVA